VEHTAKDVQASSSLMAIHHLILMAVSQAVIQNILNEVEGGKPPFLSFSFLDRFRGLQ
jgi:hypothetical protein